MSNDVNLMLVVLGQCKKISVYYYYSLLQCIRTRFSFNNFSYINENTNLTKYLRILNTFPFSQLSDFVLSEALATQTKEMCLESLDILSDL